jgi:cell shape-determining protein MreD
MDWKRNTRMLVIFLITFIVAGFMWLILGLIGYNRMGWMGVWIAGFPPVILGGVLFFILNRLFKEMYDQ